MLSAITFIMMSYLHTSEFSEYSYSTINYNQNAQHHHINQGTLQEEHDVFHQR